MLDELKRAVKAFSKVQKKYASLGAMGLDTDVVLQEQLVRAALGMECRVPATADGWKLPQCEGSEAVAEQLAAAGRRCVDIVKACPLVKAGEVVEFLRGHCYGVQW